MILHTPKSNNMCITLQAIDLNPNLKKKNFNTLKLILREKINELKLKLNTSLSKCTRTYQNEKGSTQVHAHLNPTVYI